MKKKLFLAVAFLFAVSVSVAQLNTTTFGPDSSIDLLLLSWNKNTAEQEMNADIKAFAEGGVTVQYKNIKRNERQEITAIDVSYETKIGEKGSMSYDNVRPIGEIKIYKLANEIGFGEPPAVGAGVSFSSSFPKRDVLMDNYNATSTSESAKGMTSRKQILRSDRQPLVIENGKVIEGGSDYTVEELNEILSRPDETILGDGEFKSFNYKGNQDFSEEIRKMQMKIDALMEKQKQVENKKLEQSKSEVQKAKE